MLVRQLAVGAPTMSGEIWGSVYLLVDDLEASNGDRVSA